ncbi:MAG: LamG-like jellyroll fold domain-containing protein [Candidatus Paceibacterota bacterium]|jgi:type II secretory pathway pseudopilin PulG
MEKFKLVKQNNSFTLVELLVVIGILAVLTTAVVIILNPSDYLAQARDSRRLNDLSLLNNSLQNLEAIDPTISFGTSLTVYISIPDDASSTCGTLGLPNLPSGYTYNCVSTANLTKTDGTGWVPVNFTTQSIVQLSALPIDPTNTPTDGLYYTYTPGGSWEINTILESNKYRLSGDKDRVSSDGGDSYSMYEIGTDKTISPIKDTGLVGYWKFDGGTSGSIANSSTSGLENSSGTVNSGTAGNVNGTGMTWVQGKVGGAVSFDKIDDVVNVGSDSSLDDLSAMTLSAWVYPKSGGQTLGRVLDKTTSSAIVNGYTVTINAAGTINFAVDYSSTNLSCAVSSGTPLNQWNHFVITWNGSDTCSGNVIHYINGNLAVLSATNGAGSRVSDAGSSLAIGNMSTPTRTFDGYIDDVHIYNRAISAAEAKALYNATR